MRKIEINVVFIIISNMNPKLSQDTMFQDARLEKQEVSRFKPKEPPGT